MAVEYFETGSYLYTGVTFFTILGVVWYLRRPFSFHVLQRIYARKINEDVLYLNGVLRKEKGELFQLLHEYKEKSNKNLTIVDIGSGTAASAAFLPQNTRLVCLDPNPHLQGYIDKNTKKYDNVQTIDIVQGYAENMPFESETFDAAICTFVLCVVDDIGKSLQEMKRVLKPGGKLFILQHVTGEDKGMWTCIFRCVRVPLDRLLYGCHSTRDTVKYLRNAGFSDLHLQSVYPKAVPSHLKECVIGVVTK